MPQAEVPQVELSRVELSRVEWSQAELFAKAEVLQVELLRRTACLVLSLSQELGSSLDYYFTFLSSRSGETNDLSAVGSNRAVGSSSSSSSVNWESVAIIGTTVGTVVGSGVREELLEQFRGVRLVAHTIHPRIPRTSLRAMRLFRFLPRHFTTLGPR